MMSLIQQFTKRRLAATAVVVLLLVDARAEAALRTWFAGDFGTSTSQRSTEEDERPGGKSEATGVRRQCHRVTIARHVISWTMPFRALSNNIPARHNPPVFPDHASDLRNGLGAPLLC